MIDPRDEPCFLCGRELDECVCTTNPAFDDDFDPLNELIGYDPDWDDYDKGEYSEQCEDQDGVPPPMP